MGGEYDEATSEELVTAESNEASVQVDEHQSETSSDNGIQDLINEQDREAEEFAIKFLTTVLKLRGVRIERKQFLKTELHKRKNN